MSKLPGTLYRVSQDELGRIDLEFENTDLATYSTITLRLRREDGVLIQQPAVVDDAPGGLCHFDWSAGDLNEGVHEMEFRFVTLGGKPETFPKKAPLRLQVRGQI
jgi:hypothetical protein